MLLGHSKQIRLMTASANIFIRVCVKIRRIIRYLIKTVVTVTIVLSISCAKDSEHESAGQAVVATGHGVVGG